MSDASPLDAPAVLAGVYCGLLAVGAAWAVGLPRPVLVVGGLLGWFAVALALSGRPSVWVSLGRRRLLALPMYVPLLPLLVATVALESESAPAVPLSWVLWLLGLVIAGFGLWTAGMSAYAARVAGERRAAWTAAPDPVARRRRRVGAVVAGLGAVGAVVGMFVGLPAVFLTLCVVATALLWVSSGRSRSYEACDGGLRATDSGAAASQFEPWTRFAAVRETDGAVVLERRWWLDERMAAADVPDEALETLEALIEGAGSGS
ncbi:hypothetical protein [Halopiger goleimassiliensis]|uniref:hypothetical protein n=1 Tax=Halopiger goleimassiliensis TaxID=1293048 RepID=UPI00067831EC|nr:hypothetical protein [Halopiger goleimassiliensis]